MIEPKIASTVTQDHEEEKEYKSASKNIHDQLYNSEVPYQTNIEESQEKKLAEISKSFSFNLKIKPVAE